MTLVLDFIFMKFEEIWSIFERVIHDNMNVFSVTPTGQSINAMTLKFFSDTYILLKVDRFEGFVFRSEIDGSMINNTSMCNLK